MRSTLIFRSLLVAIFVLSVISLSLGQGIGDRNRKGGEKLDMAHLYLGQVYSQKRKNAEAISELEKYLEMVPKAPNADRIKQAIEQLKKG